MYKGVKKKNTKYYLSIFVELQSAHHTYLQAAARDRGHRRLGCWRHREFFELHLEFFHIHL